MMKFKGLLLTTFAFFSVTGAVLSLESAQSNAAVLNKNFTSARTSKKALVVHMKASDFKIKHKTAMKIPSGIRFYWHDFVWTGCYYTDTTIPRSKIEVCRVWLKIQDLPRQMRNNCWLDIKICPAVVEAEALPEVYYRKLNLKRKSVRNSK